MAYDRTKQMWIRVRYDARKHVNSTGAPNLESVLTSPVIEDKIFEAAIAQHVLVVPGSKFRAEGGHGNALFFRATFATAAPEEMDQAMCRFGKALREVFGLK